MKRGRGKGSKAESKGLPDAKIIPTVLEKSVDSFNRRLLKLRKVSKKIHVDFMDGDFVEGKSIKVIDVPQLNDHIHIYEAHLMTNDPHKYINALKQKGFSKVIFHYETQKTDWEANQLSLLIRSLGMEPIIAINPETKVNQVLPLIHKSDTIMVMGVHPGKEHQKIIPETYDKIRKLRDFSKELVIQVDGGINPTTAPLLVKAGANLLNSGSYVNKSRNPIAAIKKLEQAFSKKKARKK